MQGLFLLALLMLASKGKGTSAPRLTGPRRQVKGKSGRTWFTIESREFFGIDRTELNVTSVFASPSDQDLVIAYAQFPEAVVAFPDGSKQKGKKIRALFYASPSTLTKDATSDFV